MEKRIEEMTNEEAIEWIENIEKRYIHGGNEWFDDCRRKALHTGINALLLNKKLTEENKRLKAEASDVAKEIFAEIDNILSEKIDVTKKNERRAEYLVHNDMRCFYGSLIVFFEKLQEEFAELKKKYESEENE